MWQFVDVIFDSRIRNFVCSEAIFTFLQPAVNPVLGYFIGRPAQDQLARGFVLFSSSIFFSVPHLIRARGQWLCSGNKNWDVSLSWLHLRTKEGMRPIIHLRQNDLMILMFLLDLVDLQIHHLLVIEKEWSP